jgi:hypothetical protein
MSDLPKPLENDDDLGRRSKELDFNIRRIFRYFVLYLSMAVILVLTVTFVAAIATSRTFRDAVNAEIKDNIVGIIITGLAVIGINLGALRR